MTSDELSTRIAPAKHLLGYFSQHALASYRNEPEKYVLETDSFEGSLTLTNSYYQELEEAGRTIEYLRLQFGYRTLADGELAVVLWLPDLEEAKMHQDRWMGFYLPDPVWIDAPDERFTKWVMRTLEGSWDVDNGPKHYLWETINTINGLTRELVGMPLFHHAIDASLTFPAAENTHRYQDAHRTLYGYLVDGPAKDCLAALATHLGRSENFASSRTVDALQRLFPELQAPSKFAAAMSLVSDQRRIASHAVRPPAQRFAAFTKFTDDLMLCLEGLRQLLHVLEKECGVDGIAAQRRTEAKDSLPEIHRAVHNESFLHKLSFVNGKTVQRVEYGIRRDHEGLHGSDAMILHFSDGSILGVETGSNASNVASRHDGMRPEEFSADFILTWVEARKPYREDQAG